MIEPRTANLLGTLALTLADGMLDAVSTTCGYAGESAAALVTLGAEPGISVGMLSQILLLSQPGTVRLVDRLVQAGFVLRGEGADGRTVALTLTQQGQARRMAILATRFQQLTPALAVLSIAEQTQLVGLLERMLGALTTNRLKSYTICRLCDEHACDQQICPVEQASFQ